MKIWIKGKRYNSALTRIIVQNKEGKSTHNSDALVQSNISVIGHETFISSIRNLDLLRINKGDINTKKVTHFLENKSISTKDEKEFKYDVNSIEYANSTENNEKIFFTLDGDIKIDKSIYKINNEFSDYIENKIKAEDIVFDISTNDISLTDEQVKEIYIDNNNVFDLLEGTLHFEGDETNFAINNANLLLKHLKGETKDLIVEQYLGVKIPRSNYFDAIFSEKSSMFLNSLNKRKINFIDKHFITHGANTLYKNEKISYEVLQKSFKEIDSIVKNIANQSVQLSPVYINRKETPLLMLWAMQSEDVKELTLGFKGIDQVKAFEAFQKTKLWQTFPSKSMFNYKVIKNSTHDRYLSSENGKKDVWITNQFVPFKAEIPFDYKEMSFSDFVSQIKSGEVEIFSKDASISIKPKGTFVSQGGKYE